MKHLDEYRDGKMALALADKIKSIVEIDKNYHFMEFCGGHTHTIFKYGIEEIIPKQIRMIHGPGCPVCVLPIGRLDMAINLVKRKNIILCTYGDMLRVPGSNKKSLLTARAEGADIRMVYSCLEAINIAIENPKKEIVFFAIGFETTTPHSAMAINHAHSNNINNFTIFCNHVLTPSAVQSILESPEVRKLGTIPLDGFIGPGHVSTIIGTQPYEFFAEEYQKPVVITGFELMDIMQSIFMLVKQVNENRYEVENQYIRGVTKYGNQKAKEMVANIFELRKLFEWRGLGNVPYSALRIKKQYINFDAEYRFNMKEIFSPEHKGCDCSAVLRGIKKPTDCKLFASVCTPENPIGSCMVSNEGTCAAYYIYNRVA